MINGYFMNIVGCIKLSFLNHFLFQLPRMGEIKIINNLTKNLYFAINGRKKTNYNKE